MSRFLTKFPRASLGTLPTPLMELKKLSAILGGPRIFIKRDDLTGLALGGNKVRKLEYLCGDAIHKGCDTIVTGGITQSNFCRQTAGAAATLGLNCHLLLYGPEPELYTGHLLLKRVLGSHIHWNHDKSNWRKEIDKLQEDLKLKGLKPYFVPLGGSNPIGALGYVNAISEVLDQLKNIDVNINAMVLGSSSAGTQAGLLVGAALESYKGRIIGVQADEAETKEMFCESTMKMIEDTNKLIGESIQKPNIEYDGRFVGEGYATLGQREIDTILLLARKEGILLDPVYTSRAMSALIYMIKKGELKKTDNVLLWHTGGGLSVLLYPEKFAHLK